MIELVSFLQPADLDNIMNFYPDDPSQGVPFGRQGNKRFLRLGWQWRRAAAITGDVSIIAFTRLFARLVSQKAPVYKYRFNATDPTKSARDYSGAAHLLELNYVWNNPALRATSADADKLVRIMSRRWVSFIVSQNPNGHGLNDLPYWNTYQSAPEGENTVFQLDSTYREKDSWRKNGIDTIITARERVQ